MIAYILSEMPHRYLRDTAFRILPWCEPIHHPALPYRQKPQNVPRNLHKKVHEPASLFPQYFSAPTPEVHDRHLRISSLPVPTYPLLPVHN